LCPSLTEAAGANISNGIKKDNVIILLTWTGDHDNIHVTEWSRVLFLNHIVTGYDRCNGVPPLLTKTFDEFLKKRRKFVLFPVRVWLVGIKNHDLKSTAHVDCIFKLMDRRDNLTSALNIYPESTVDPFITDNVLCYYCSVFFLYHCREVSCNQSPSLYGRLHLFWDLHKSCECRIYKSGAPI
jgi:hypothetical protein